MPRLRQRTGRQPKTVGQDRKTAGQDPAKARVTFQRERIRHRTDVSSRTHMQAHIVGKPRDGAVDMSAFHGLDYLGGDSKDYDYDVAR